MQIDIEKQEQLQRLIEQMPTSLAREAAVILVSEFFQSGKMNSLDSIIAPPGHDRRPVSMKQFLEDSDYMGGIENLWPDVKADLIRLFDEGEYVECLISGSIGSGKSVFGSFTFARLIYELSCLTDPAGYYGLMPGSYCYLVNQSVNEKLAKKVLFSEVKQRIDQSPYFKAYFPPDPQIDSELRFPKHVTVMPLAAGDTSALGLNVFGGILDEAAFYKVVEHSSRSHSINEVYDIAEKMYNTISRRLRSRFMQAGGKIPGKILVISSANYEDDFVERKKKEAREELSTKGKTLIFVRQKALWESKEMEWSPERFKVEIGGSLGRPRILTGDETPDQITGEVIEVPIEFRDDFEKDIIGAVRDIAGRATSAIDPFLPDAMALQFCIDSDRQHPFSSFETNLQDGIRLIKERVARFNEERQKWEPIYFPRALRYAHIDYALTDDECGVAIGCPAGYIDVQRKNFETGELKTVRAPVCHIDMILKIVAPRGGEIDLEETRNLTIIAFRELGFQIRWCTFDQFASAEAQQQLRKRGIESERLSVDVSMNPYITWKEGVKEYRVRTYEYPHYTKEAASLEVNRVKGKVDHPPGKDKGLTDAVASVCEQIAIHAPESMEGWSEYLQKESSVVAAQSREAKTLGEAQKRDAAEQGAPDMNKLQQSKVIKPATNPQTEKCPQCGATNLARYATVVKCNACNWSKPR